MNGRRARLIRREADELCAQLGTPTPTAHYRPQEIRNRAGHVLDYDPALRLMPGPRAMARHLRRHWTRHGELPTLRLPNGEIMVPGRS